MAIRTKIYAAFCGTGKTYLCNNFPDDYFELECWEYQSGDFPNNYIKDIFNKIGKVKYLFISTNPVVLEQLYKQGVKIILIYPDKSLKEKYMKRFCERNSSYDFIGVMYKHWDDWLDELKELNYCKQIILKSNEYLLNVINKI